MNKSFWQDLPKPIIGLAPMDGYSDSAFRRICKEVNPNIVTVTDLTPLGACQGLKTLISNRYILADVGKGL